ncbi:hypothetical protein SteCoe_6447 [Stentor coeruleus]|uniref:Uncharacterized protein n=1 Tax=Stentor coeruleus TaxID=5963 RepID=A0A1R2CQ22_9CILI|nr:hypothetical protein SteCoe_6447 [Stentor coeruleus]
MINMNFNPQRLANKKSATPVNGKYKYMRLSPNKEDRITKSVRNISLSPLRHSSSRKSSNDTIINLRAVSSELNTLNIFQDTEIQRLNSMLSDQPRAKSYQKILPKVEKTKNYHEVIEALFSMYNCEKGRIGAVNLTQLFVSLEFCEDCDTIVEIFRNISEGQPLNMISYSKQELIKLCEDSKTDNVLRSIFKELKIIPALEKIINVHSLIEVIKKWWNHLEKSPNGYASFEDICKCYTEIGIIENASDKKRIFLRINQYGNYKQFISVFAKTLLKHMISELGKVVEKGNKICLPAKIAISTQRRKVILKSLEGNTKVVDAIIECNLYNK